MSTADLPHARPSERGVDAAGVAALIDALESAPGVAPHSLVLLRGGAVVAEGWWAPYAPDRLHLLYSLSKSFTAAGVGLAVDAGLLSLDDPVTGFFPEFDADLAARLDTSARNRVRRMRVRHLLAMGSGHREETLERAVVAGEGDIVRGFLLTPPEEEPGSIFAYNQPCTFLLARIVERATGATLLDWLRPRLLDPLGIGEVAWLADPSGRALGFSGLHATTDAIARLAQLHLDRGVWRGRRLLSAEWVAEATREHIATPRQDGVDWTQGYGFQFWMARHGYRGDGAYGQFAIVLPEHDVVLAITSETSDMQTVLDAVWRHLLPALGEVSESSAPSAPSAAEDALAERLAGLELPPVAGARPGPAWSGFSAATPAAPADPRPAALLAGAGPAVAAVSVRAEADGLVATITEAGPAGWSFDAPLTPEWSTVDAPGPLGTVPLAVSAAEIDDALVVDVVALETPHRLRLTCRRTAAGVAAAADGPGTLEVAWNTVPLHPLPLHASRAPR